MGIDASGYFKLTQPPVALSLAGADIKIPDQVLEKEGVHAVVPLVFQGIGIICG